MRQGFERHDTVQKPAAIVSTERKKVQQKIS
jgi:hypothetical protein